MAKDLWEANIFDGVIYVRLSFWHSGRKGGCARSISTETWEFTLDQTGLLKHIISDMQFGKAELIADL